MTRLIRWARNIWGDRQGYGRCEICGDSWSWKKWHVTELRVGLGLILYCTECAENKPLAERKAALAQFLARHD